jgi:hypothetical protein
MDRGMERMTKDKKAIYILLTDTGTIVSQPIKWFTNAPYNHVSIVFDDQLREVYSFARKKLHNPWVAGFIKEEIYAGRFFEDTTCTLLKLYVSEEEFMKMRQIVQYFKENEEKLTYNLPGLFGVLIRYPIKKKNAYFCSQFVAEVFLKSGVYFWDLPPELITPNHFFTNKNFEVIYEGRLYDCPFLVKEEIRNDLPRRLVSGLVEKIKSFFPSPNL